MRRFRRVSALVLVVSAVAVPISSSSSASIHIAHTDGQGVLIRPTPDTTQTAVGLIPENASPDYTCFTYGENVNGVPIWFNVNYGGKSGFYASYFDDSSYSSDGELTQKYGIPKCAGSEPAPAAARDLVFPATNASGGVYYRRSPHWSDTAAESGVGVYDGDRLHLICGATGDPVGPGGNTAWSYVENQSRPTIGAGWVSEHFIDDGAAPGQLAAGEPQCGTTPGAANAGAGHTSAPPGGSTRSVFFSPIDDVDTGVRGISVADKNVLPRDWISPETECDPARAHSVVPSGATILSGWSRGRLGPIYYLAAATDEERAALRTIILFDPGSAANFRAGCDSRLNPPTSRLLADWLRSDPNHRLIVYTGHDSEEHSLGWVGHASFAGLWHFYFPDIWNQPFAGRAQVCDYNNLGHKDVLRQLAWTINNPLDPSVCPTVNGTAGPKPWNP
jgi:hypothetical protein